MQYGISVVMVFYMLTCEAQKRLELRFHLILKEVEARDYKQSKIHQPAVALRQVRLFGNSPIFHLSIILNSF